MSVDVTHLVLEALGDANDQVVDDAADGTEASDTLTGTVVHLDRDDILLGTAESDGDVREILNKLAWIGGRERVSAGCKSRWRSKVSVDKRSHRSDAESKFDWR